MARDRGGGPMPSHPPKMPSPREMLKERVHSVVTDALGALASPTQCGKACDEMMAVLDRHAKETTRGT